MSNTCGEKQFLFETSVFSFVGGKGNQKKLCVFCVGTTLEVGKGVRRCFLMSEGLENLRNLTYPICSVLLGGYPQPTNSGILTFAVMSKRFPLFRSRLNHRRTR